MYPTQLCFFSLSDTSPTESPNSSPVSVEELNLEGDGEEMFMKANFESLSAADADKFFGTTHSLADACCSRLSISTRFLTQSVELVVCVCVCVCVCAWMCICINTKSSMFL